MACRKPYFPGVVAASHNYLVVEGVINSGSDSTIIKLNRTVRLTGGSTVNPELGAGVTVESDAGESVPLGERPHGVYVSPGLNLNSSHKYRLRIKTAGGKQYLSNFEPVLVSPPIDTVTYKVQSSGLALNVNTHDPKNASRYYRWEYDETWVFFSAYDSFYKSNGDTVIRRQVDDQINMCWRTTFSSTIVLGSTAKLAHDVISDAPIGFLPIESIKIKFRYSPLVRQYVLTKEAYDFWANLKKTSEQLGGIFDAQPTQINGNIHSVTDPGEPVIGYVSVGTFSTKRIYIDRQELPVLKPANFDGCELKTYLYRYKDPITGAVSNQVDEYMNFNKSAVANIIPVNALEPEGSGYSGSTIQCVDCRVNGTNKAPDFWVPYKVH